ncbi:hypothetical protein CEXT_170811 [Caerostris extrusa]|uniref:Uncharacterized protein n=1 Tax=Caerostris extrusa TaxID=172846 RepID=A0AAV4XWE1_CAEEX|nr:hypothetical protein CEXT_170811 [Caerostris extrusa]
MRIAAGKLPLLLKRGVPQSHCISSVYLYIEDTMFEVNTFSNFKSILKSPSYEHLLMRIAAGKLPLLPKRGVLNPTVYLVYISISKIRCSR